MQNTNEETQQPEVIQTIQKKKKSGCISRIAKFILIVLIIWWFNNFTIKINDCIINSEKVSDNINIAVISDLHESKMSVNNDSVIKKLKKQNPDFICVLGDMHSSDAAEDDKAKSLKLMTDLVDDGYRVYFVLGEHDDRTKSYVDNMETQGINVLDSETADIEIKNTKIRLYGISNAYFSPTFDLNNIFDTPSEDYYNILLAHIPMYEDYKKFGADLSICGDTHGGVIQVPFCGPAYYNEEILPELREGEKNIYDKGLFGYDGGYMFITSGLGNYPLPIRFNNRPEIAIINVVPK